MRTIAEHIARASREARDLVLVTIMESKGSTPRHAGSQMLVDENGLACGTIGGGASRPTPSRKRVACWAAI